MSEATAVYCDGPKCESQQGPAPQTLPFPGWVRVLDHVAGPVALDFCGWDCAIKFGARINPTNSSDIEIRDAS